MTALEPSRPRPLRWELGRARAIAYGWVFLAAQLLMLGFIVLRSHGVIGGAADHSTTDFMMTYASGTMANAGTPAQVYDLAHQAAQQQQIFGPRKLDVVLTFYYPPIYLIACAVLARLPYLVGFAVWVAATGGLFVAALGRIVRDWRLVVALCSFPAAVVTLGIGQNAFLSAALLSWGMILIDRRPWLAGFALGGLAFKPHFLVLLPVALLAGGRWRAIAGGVASSLLLAAVSAAWFGIETWRSFFTHLAMAEDLYGGGAFGYWAQTSLFAAVRLLGGGYGVALAVHAAGMAAAAAATAYGWWKDASLPVRAILVIGGTLVCVPVNLSYDLLAAAGAVAFLCRDDLVPRLRPWEKGVIAAAWLITLAGRGVAEKTGMPLLPLVALGLLAIAATRLFGELAPPAPRLESSRR